MNKFSHSRWLLIPFALLLTGQGCLSLGSRVNSPEGGIYRSADRGETWQRKNDVISKPGSAYSIQTVNVRVLVGDPSDPKALYLGTAENGLIYSYDGAETWQLSPIVSTSIADVAVDPQARCTTYVATRNTVLRSADCSRHYDTVYNDNQRTTEVLSLAVNPLNTAVVYAGLSTGGVLISVDGGASWVARNWFTNPVQKLIIDPGNPRTMFVATRDQGLFRSTDSGGSWASLTEQLRAFPNSNQYRALVLQNAVLYYASQYGILRSANGGSTWQELRLLTKPEQAAIYALAVDQTDPQRIYYTTDTTFYRSQDGGQNWVPRRLPGSRAGTALVVDWSEPDVLYLGVTKIAR